MTKSVVKKDNDIGTTLAAMMANGDIPVDKLEKFMDLQERIMDKNSESAFNISMSKFQSECPVIKQERKVSYSTTNYSYATLDEIIYQIKPLLAKHGLSYTFDTKPVGEKEFEIITKISHIEGCSRDYSLIFPKLDSGGKMNDTQRVKSALTYAKRAGIENALGIVCANEDDDARRLNDKQITDDQVKKIRQLIGDTGSDLNKMLSAFSVTSVEELNNEDYAKATSMLMSKLSVDKRPAKK